MANTSETLAVGNFLEWPPSRYLAEGFYSDANKTTIRPDLLGDYALKSAFRFLSQGVTPEVAQDLAAELQKAAAARPATRRDLQAAINHVARRLLEEPFVRTLSLYEFFSECAAFLGDAGDLEALSRHVGCVANRLSLIEAMRMADPNTVALPDITG